MNRIRVTALTLAVVMILTLFVFAVDTAPEAEAPEAAETAETVTRIETVPAQTRAAAPVQHEPDTEQTVQIGKVVSIETVAAADRPDPVQTADEAVTKAVEAAIERCEPEPEVESKETAGGSYRWGVTAHALSDTDRDLIERVVAAEAMGCVYDGLVGVAQVIRERAESWGMSAREVVTAEGQFASPYRGEVTDEVKQAVSDVFDYGVRVFKAYTTHFHNTSCDPFWNNNKVFRGEIDRHLFWGVDEE